MSEETTTTTTAPTTTVSPPTANPTPEAASSPNTSNSGNAAPGDWTSSLSPELKVFVGNKQFKDPAQAVDSLMNLEKLMGAPKDRLLKLPEAADSPEWEAINQRLGKPAKAEDYKFPEIPKEFGVNEEFTKFAKDMFHKANLTSAQAEKVMTEWVAKNQADIANIQAAQTAKVQQEESALKTKWGNAFDQNLNIAKAGAKESGLTVEQIDSIQSSLGYQKTMELFNSIGSKLGEASFTSGQNPGFGSVSPETARAEIANLQKDSAFMNKYLSGDSQAKAKMEKLHRDASPGEMSI